MKLSELTSCLPCTYGVHDICRHYPEGRQFSSPGSEKGKPCLCEKSGHEGEPGTCYYHIRNDWDSSRCGRPAKGEAPSDWLGNKETLVEVCGIHLNGWKKREANAKGWQEKWDAERQLEKDMAAASHASEDWAQKFRDEFGLPVEGMKADRDKKIRVALSPEQAYTKLNEIRSLLDEIYGSEHPWSRD